MSYLMPIFYNIINRLHTEDIAMNSRERRKLAAQQHNDAVDRELEERSREKPRDAIISGGRRPGRSLAVLAIMATMNTQRIDR